MKLHVVFSLRRTQYLRNVQSSMRVGSISDLILAPTVPVLLAFVSLECGKFLCSLEQNYGASKLAAAAANSTAMVCCSK